METLKVEKKNFSQKGEILILASVTLVILLTLGAYFLTFTLTESRISKSQIEATKTYYLAEAGIQEAIWKLKNDPAWKESFETPPGCYAWSANFSKEGVLFPNGVYQVQIQNSTCARGQIISTATLNFPDGRTAQRIVKTKVFKAFGSLTGEGAVFSGGTSENVDISACIINIYNGNLFSNHNTNISSLSDVNVFDNPNTQKLEGKALSNGNIIISWNSSLDATAVCGKNICQGDCAEEGCPADTLPLPMVDFDSSEPTSYKSKAQTLEVGGQCSVLCNGTECATKCVYTETEFDNLLWQVGQGGTLVLNNEITYVTGSIRLRGGRNLVVSGALVADGTVDIGETYCWKKGNQDHCGYNQITINDPGQGKPSGLLTKRKINIGFYSSFRNIEITGLIYANDEMRIVSLPWSFRITGGIIARKVSLTSLWSTFNIYLDNSIILEGIWAGPNPPEEVTPPYSPVVTIEHWEESY